MAREATVLSMLLLCAVASGASPACAAGGAEHGKGPDADTAQRVGMTYRQADAERAFRGALRATVRFPGGRLIAAELADTPERSAYGYMFRTDVKEDEGMVFVYPQSDVHPFWMKNTLVPLDIIWMDDEFTILYIQAATPPCKADPCPSYGTPRLSRYILEVRSGTAAHEGLKAGDRLAIAFPGDGGGS